jgi:hypothetical protein
MDRPYSKGRLTAIKLFYPTLIKACRWHQDIKPENILLVSNDAQSPYDWQFKLGDLGLSHFNSNVVSSREPTASDAHGTRTYGSFIIPPYRSALPLTRSQAHRNATEQTIGWNKATSR